MTPFRKGELSYLGENLSCILNTNNIDSIHVNNLHRLLFSPFYRDIEVAEHREVEKIFPGCGKLNEAENEANRQVQQKVSCTFRSQLGADSFCRIWGYISIASENSISVLDAIQSAFEGFE